MWLLKIVAFSALFLSRTIDCLNSKNLDIDHPLVLHSEVDDSFGFSFAMIRQKSGSWMMVGAPKLINNDTKRLGTSFKCEAQKKCVDLKQELNYTTWESGINYLETVYDKMMFGFAMDANDEMFMTCAPQVGIIDTTPKSKNWKMHGACVWGKTDMSSYSTIVPFDDITRNLMPWAGKQKKYFTLGEAGFSVNVLKTTKNVTQFLIGAPNVLEGLGTVIKFSVTKGQIPDRTSLIIPDSKRTFSNDSSIGLGYSVSSGKYLSKNKTLYATGAPSFNAQGKVLVFDFKNHYISTFEIKRELDGTNLGEYFGAALASGDTNNDGLDELIVGAPLFSSQDGWDQGRFFVFSFSGNQTSPKAVQQEQVFVGKVTGGRFGTAVAYLGDLNGDKFGDVATSAPYEDQGVVYIYYGSKKGLSLEYRIVGSQYEPLISRFGFTITKGADFDYNGYNDFAVGAYKSGHILIFKSKPIIKLDLTLTPDVPALMVGQKNFTVTECVSFKGSRVPAKISLVKTLEIGTSVKRIAFQNLRDENATFLEIINLLKKNETMCSSYSFYLRENVTDFKTSLKMTFEYKLENISQKSSKNNAPIIAPMLLKKYSKELVMNFKQLCGENETCIADLHVDMEFLDSNHTKIVNYVIGSTSPVILKVMVSNKKMAAYDGIVSIKHSSNLNHNPNIGRCKEIDNDDEKDEGEKEIQCPLVNPLTEGKTHSFLIEFDSSEITSTNGQFEFSASVNSTSEMLETSKTTAIEQLSVISIAGVTISGKTDPEIIQLEYGSNFEVQVTLEKLGISPIESVEVLLRIPYAVPRGDEFLKIHSFMTKTGSCTEINEQSQDTQAETTDKEADSDLENDEGVEEDDNDRKKRDTSSEQNVLKTRKFPANRTLAINCSNSKIWVCQTLKCYIGPNLQKNNVEIIYLNATADFSALEKQMGSKDYVQIDMLSTVSIQKPSNAISPDSKQPTRVIVTATFKRKVSNWVQLSPMAISLAIICSLLLLLLLITGLVKVGFFTRQDKEAMLREKLKMRPPIVSLRELQTMHEYQNLGTLKR